MSSAAISWRGPFFGVSALMLIALVATARPAARDAAHRRAARDCPNRSGRCKHRSLAVTSVVGLLYNWAFFTVLGYTPFLMDISSPQKLGLVFCAWGILVAFFAVIAAPRLQRRFGTPRTLYANFVLMALDIAAIAIWPDRPVVVIVAVIVAGAFIGVNNTLVTTAVMSIAPVERPVASATYGFVRFIGGGLAPFVAGKLVERYNAHVPFVLAVGTLLLATATLRTVHRALDAADRGEMRAARAGPAATGRAGGRDGGGRRSRRRVTLGQRSGRFSLLRSGSWVPGGRDGMPPGSRPADRRSPPGKPAGTARRRRARDP